MYKGILISGKICSGKGAFFSIFKELTGNDFVVQLAFADKLKLLAKYLLVQLSHDPEHAVEKISQIIWDQLFDNKVDLARIQDKIDWLIHRDYISEFCFPNLQMPSFDGQTGLDFPTKNFDFGDIDKILWIDCPKPRKLLQEIGTEVMRSIRGSVWVDYVFFITEKHPEYFVIIPDGRFPNEIEIARRNNFLDIRIEANQETRIRRGLERDGQDYSGSLTHLSETALDSHAFSTVLDNNGTP